MPLTGKKTFPFNSERKVGTHLSKAVIFIISFCGENAFFQKIKTSNAINPHFVKKILKITHFSAEFWQRGVDNTKLIKLRLRFLS